MSENMSQKKKIVVLHHNDLDGSGCALNIHNKFSNLPQVSGIEYFTTNYKNLSTRVDEIVEFCHRNLVSTLFICDVCFTNNLSDLEILSELNKINIKIIYIDHHLYTDEFNEYFLFNKNKKFGISFILGTSKSATQLTSEFLKITDPGLLQINNLINLYDIWVSNDPKFTLGLYLNNYFWKLFKDRRNFTDVIVSNNYNLPPEFKEFIKKDKVDCDNYLQNLEERKLIYKQVKNNEATYIIFADEYYQNFVYEKFKELNTKCIIIVNSFGGIKVRFKDSFNQNTKDFIRKELIGNIQGHQNAFAYVCKTGIDNIMSEVRRIYDIIS